MSPTITIIVPVHNGQKTLRKALESIENQEHRSLIHEIMIINDGSSDDSQAVINEFARTTKLKVSVIRHDTAHGLAASYNEAIGRAKTEFALTMHQDVVVRSAAALLAAINPMLESGVVAATFPVIAHPRALWRTYNFWQKCMFSRYIDRNNASMTGKFDALRLEAVRKVGLFDQNHFRTAGEDADLQRRLERKKLLTVPSGVAIQHAEEPSPRFSLGTWIHKEAQYAEARGAVLRLHGPSGIFPSIFLFFRELLIIGLFIPFVGYFVVVLILAYCWAYTSHVYYAELQNPKVLVLPFINLWLLPVNAFYSARGFLRRRQII